MEKERKHRIALATAVSLAIYLILMLPLCKLFHVKPGILGTHSLCDYTMGFFGFFVWGFFGFFFCLLVG